MLVEKTSSQPQYHPRSKTLTSAFDSRSQKRQRKYEEESSDRISELPEALIIQILSLLPTKSAMATSVLSKQWQFLWKMMPVLKFDYCDHIAKTFPENVCKSLLSHKAPILESLHLNFGAWNCTSTDIEMLTATADARHLRELVLKVESKLKQFGFPKTLYNCETLETLILKLYVYVDAPSQVCLKSLKTLHLDNVFFKNEASVVNFLSSFPNLENLLFDPTVFVKGFEIKIPTGIIFNQLVHLELCASKAWWNLVTFMLNSSPRLRVFKLIKERVCWSDNYIAYGQWNQPKDVPECLLFYLETFMWIGYNEYLVREEKKVAKYILRNANILKRATFSSKRITSDDRLELESVSEFLM
ncbi:unnamed protein product [Thlaspi arvense]|uniref:F-box domain-containing protein n=1 Tax=Thlaspi arvense TaxID=13288 RepID=A0AAU9SC77_THLAR|nr:unnamed protein product [Thlaspi arvense]